MELADKRDGQLSGNAAFRRSARQMIHPREKRPSRIGVAIWRLT